MNKKRPKAIKHRCFVRFLNLTRYLNYQHKHQPVIIYTFESFIILFLEKMFKTMTSNCLNQNVAKTPKLIKLFNPEFIYNFFEKNKHNTRNIYFKLYPLYI